MVYLVENKIIICHAFTQVYKLFPTSTNFHDEYEKMIMKIHVGEKDKDDALLEYSVFWQEQVLCALINTRYFMFFYEHYKTHFPVFDSFLFSSFRFDGNGTNIDYYLHIFLKIQQV